MHALLVSYVWFYAFVNNMHDKISFPKKKKINGRCLKISCFESTEKATIKLVETK